LIRKFAKLRIFAGSTVRNLLAFQVLQSTFLRARSEQLTSTILDAISTIYTADNANYFLLESEHTLSQFAEKLASKPKKAQEKFFQVLEFLVHHLKYVPCKELISVSLLLKSHQNIDCCVLAIKALTNIVRFDATFRDVFREVGKYIYLRHCPRRPHLAGLLEVLVELLDMCCKCWTAPEEGTHSLQSLISEQGAETTDCLPSG
jgi:hypothetical protein